MGIDGIENPLQDPEEAELPEGQTLWTIPGTNPEAREVTSFLGEKHGPISLGSIFFSPVK